jgi:hypothetical protein
VDQFAACFEGLEDPRSGNAALHDFHALLIIALCTTLCGGQGAVDMALFARAQEPFLREFLNLKNGPPSHNTFSRLFRALDPAQFRTAFQRFMAAFSEACQGVVAIDGGPSRDPGDHDDWDRTSRVCCRLGPHGWNGRCVWLGWGLMVSPGV